MRPLTRMHVHRVHVIRQMPLLVVWTADRGATGRAPRPTTTKPKYMFGQTTEL